MGSRQQDVSQYDSKQVIRGEELGRMQQLQLQRQWGDFTRRMNNVSGGPEEIVVDDSEQQVAADDSKFAAKTTEDANATARRFNVTVEKIVVDAIHNESGVVSARYSESDTVIDDTVKVNMSAFLGRGISEEQIVIESADPCVPHNTRTWLQGSRLSNADYNLTDDFVFRQILMQNPLHPYVLKYTSEQTICHADSRVRNPSFQWDIANEKLIDEWEFRLTYMAIHRHQHMPAIEEAELRHSCPSELNISKMDYECPSAKFLVTNIAPAGLGAAFRIAGVNSILMGIATGRVAIFVNNFAGGPPFLQKASELFSCPRGDMQCVFLPITPCAILASDLLNATVLPEVDARSLRRMGTLERPEYTNSTILVLEPRVSPPKAWSIQTKIQDRLYSLAMEMIDGIRESASDEHVQFLEAAAARIKQDNATIAHKIDNENTTEYRYGNRYTKTAHAALLYLMRPNANYQLLSDEVIAHIVPDDLDLGLAMGLPIRGSDKCKSESTCYVFDTYMKLMQQLWRDRLGSPRGKNASIVLTTEDMRIMKAREDFKTNESFPFKFFYNSNDILQGSGRPKDFKGRADLIMLSSIVSIKLQLHTRILVGNCCSNFHLMLFDLYREGCGAVPSGEVMCLQEHPDPQFHACCGWTRTEECDRIRDAEAEERKRQTEIAEKKRNATK
jgi:hypothetical protein